MTYSTIETSVDSGVPVELYKFVGTNRDYLYTSHSKIITFNSEVYIPIAMDRGDISTTDSQDKQELTVTIPVDTQLVEDYVFDIAPPALEVTVYRLHRDDNDFVQYWYGRVSSFALKGRKVSIKIPSGFDLLFGAVLPNIYFQTMCNHVLYGPFCGVNRASFTHTTTVATVNSTTVFSLTDDGGRPDGWYNGGEVVLGSERRLVLAHVGDQITINHPFRAMVVGDTVDIAAGCDRTIGTCRAKFSNQLNFLGFPYLPKKDPFREGV